LLQPRTRPALRAAILDRYDVRFILVSPAPAGCMPFKAVADFRTFGDVIARAGNLELVQLRRVAR
jgi:hypothetical protein